MTGTFMASQVQGECGIRQDFPAHALLRKRAFFYKNSFVRKVARSRERHRLGCRTRNKAMRAGIVGDELRQAGAFVNFSNRESRNSIA